MKTEETSKRPNVQTSKCGDRLAATRQGSASLPAQRAAFTRVSSIIMLSVFLLSILTITIVMNIFAQRPELRSRIDATKTRAYSLSPQTREMVRGLEGQWTIAVLVTEEQIDRSVRLQIDEVLTRFDQAAPNLNVTRIDPTDPRTLVEYEALLAHLRAIDGDLVDQYEHQLDRAEDAFRELIVFAQQQSGRLDQMLQLLDPQQHGMNELVERTRMVGLIAEQGEDVLEEVQRARQITGGRPIPDYDLAQSVLAQALTAAANEMYDAATMFEDWTQQVGLHGEPRQFISDIQHDLEAKAREIARIVDPLMHLEPLELATVGRTIAEGEAAVIIGPDSAAVIPSAQLFPRSNIRATDAGGVTFDQRFRGEQLLAAAIRSLLVEHMPLVVFVHASDRSLFRPHDRQADLVGVIDTLTASRFDVKEWGVGRTDRPRGEPSQPIVWVIVPPAQRSGMEPDEHEMRLIETTQQLLAEGESVLVSAYPSLLPRYGQRDPWATVAEMFGLKVDTGSVIYESIRTGPDEREIQRGLAVQRFAPGHVISNAVDGQQTSINLPMAIQIAAEDELQGGIRLQVLLEVEPAHNRWLEANWSEDPRRLGDPSDETRFDESLPVIVTAERSHPMESGTQRMMLVGSGGWMLSYIADIVVPIGGDRRVLMNPGNYELMLASAAWLAGMDELIAQSPTTQEVARLGEISEAAGRTWFWIGVVGLPAACLVLGVFVWGVRRV